MSGYEIIGLSGLISVTQLCLAVISVLDGTTTFKEDLASLYAEYTVEKYRFSLWASKVLGVSNPANIDQIRAQDVELPPYIANDSSIDFGEPLDRALKNIHSILRDVCALLEKYGSPVGRQNGPGSVAPAAQVGDLHVSFRRKLAFETGVYKDGGKEKLKKLLKQFKDWNDRLDSIIASKARHQVMSDLQVLILSSAQTNNQLALMQQAVAGQYPSLGSGISFQRRYRDIEGRTGSTTSSNELRIDVARLCPAFPPDKSEFGLRETGSIAGSATGGGVLLEWKLGQADWSPDDIKMAKDRAAKLAEVLHLDHKPKQLRSLDLVSYALKDTELPGDETRLDFCFVFRLPAFTSPSCELATLESTITTPGPDKHRPTLGQKFSIAAMLAESLLEIHAHGWIHKAVCSRNILFFRQSQSASVVPDFASPFMAGFEFARPDTVHQKSLDFFHDPSFDVYCHPELDEAIRGKAAGRPRYQRQYDIYGLGITLLELGT